MALIKNQREFIVYEYDFAEDGGAIGTVNLRPVGSTQLAAGQLVVYAVADVETAFASADSMHTVDVGDGTDADEWFADTALGAASSGDLVASATLALVKLTSGTAQPVFTIGTTALTAGKAKFYFEVLKV